MTWLDRDDRRALEAAGPLIAQVLALVCIFVAGVLIFAVTAGVALRLFGFASGW